VFRLLATMEELGFIEQCRVSGRYRLGLATHALGQASRARDR
jgi:DNA-binding IclR family transcriptional regulator